MPALSQRRLSLMRKLPPASARLMVLVEPAGVSSVPLPRRVAALPLAVKAPVTATVPLPSSAGLAPLSVRLVKVVVTGELMPSAALFSVSVAGSDTAAPVDERFSVAPARLSTGTDRLPAADRVAVPPVIVRLGRPRAPAALTVSEPDDTVVARSEVDAPVPLSVTLAPATVRLEPPAGLDADASVRVPAAKTRPVPAAMA